jgi:hypothetical protein
VNNINLSLEEQRESAFGSLSLARLAWIDVMQDLHSSLLGSTPVELEKRPGLTNGADDWKSFRLDDVAVESVGERSGGTVELVLSSPEPKATELGLQKYRSRVARALNKWYGRDVRLLLRGTEVQVSQPPKASGSNEGEHRTV